MTQSPVSGAFSKTPGEDLFNVLLSAAVDGIVVIDEHGTVEIYSQSCNKLFQYTADEVIGKNVKILMPSRYSQEHDGYLRHYAETGERRIIGIGREVEGRRKDGTTFPMYLSVGEGSVAGRKIFVGIIRDLTQEKLDAAVRFNTTKRLAAIVESSTDAIVSKTLDGIVTSWNASAERIFGYTADEIIGETIRILVPDDRRTEIDDVMARLRAGESIEHFETVRRHKNGSNIDVSTTLSPIRDDKGRTVGAAVITRDITEEKIAEHALREQAANLKRSNELLTQFAYAASHDLQEPLRAVAGSVQLLEKRYAAQLDDRARKFIRHAVEGAQRMHQMIDDLLAFSRVQRAPRVHGAVDLNTAVSAAMQNLAQAIADACAQIQVQTLPTVLGNKEQMVMLLQNILGNAIKFHRADIVPQIRVRAEDKGNHWEIIIDDNGIGIPADQTKRVFELFQRLHTREEYLGTGIGLALCRQIVQSHGGTIGVNSQPGEGSSFFFTLPSFASSANR
ncbi:MAG: PAS domain S-box protein [Rhodospirillales bacterium]|nr:PAS domain S-box protein [Rhodospirillales bacterium]